MEKMRRVLAALSGAALVLSLMPTGVLAEEEAPASYDVTFQGEVTDAGQCVSGMTIDFGKDVTGIEGVDKDTFTINFTDTVAYGSAKGKPYAYVDASKPLPVASTSVEGSKVTVNFQLNALPTLNWLAEGRNYPADLTLDVKQAKDITLKKTSETSDKRVLEESVKLGTDTVYTNNVKSYANLEDPETAKFTGVKADIDYQYHKGTNDALIVWFHGNGEGDFADETGEKLTGNNVAQMLANRGTVAWATPEAQAVFGDATVMAFQSPNQWYFANQEQDYLTKSYNEIQQVVKANGIDPDKIYVSGCSAGGFMSTRMIIAYPDLFKAAMINCPALDIANVRSGRDNAVPTDEELAKLKDSRTAIWLVQGKTDSSVNPENCSKRIWKVLTAGAQVTEKSYAGKDGIASGFTTYEEPSGKYKLSLYDTVDVADGVGTLGDTRPMGKLVVSEDYNRDGVKEPVKVSDHWSWIYTLINDPNSSEGHIWNWALNYKEKLPVVKGTQKLVVTGDDWGPGVSKTILTLDEPVSKDGLNVAGVTETKESTNWADLSVYNASAARKVEKVYLSDAEGNETSDPTSKYVSIEMYISPNDGSPFRYDVPSGSNKWCSPYELAIDMQAVNAEGKTVQVSVNPSIDFSDYSQWVSQPAMEFDVAKTFKYGDITMPYGEWKPAADDHKNPLVIWLHGAGEGVSKFDNDNYVDLLGNEVTALISPEFQKEFNGAYVITPQAQTMWMDGGDGQYQNGDKGSMYEEALFALIQNYVANNDDVDPNRIIIGGCSNGGYMTMEMILKHPDYFYKAYPICEAFYDEYITDKQVKDLAESHMGIWFTYSRDDGTVDPTKCSIPTIERLKKAGADVHVSSWDHVVDLTGRFKDADGNPYQYMGHWSWIYFDNNANVEDTTGENEWKWLANNLDPVYSITEGADAEYKTETGKDLSFTADMLYAKFRRVEVDGKELEAGKDYTAAEGSVIVTLKADYLKTLKAGKHTLDVYARDGKAETNFTVIVPTPVEKVKKEIKMIVSPDTSDPANMAAYFGAFIVMIAAAGAILVYRRRHN